MLTSYYLSIIKLSALALISYGLISCQSRDDSMDEILHGDISYPFYEPNPLGRNGKEEKFIIRSAVGNTEYTIEIPGAARDYDIEIPLASLDSAATGGPDRPRGLAKPNVTDRELIANFPSIQKSDPAGTGFMDKAFGVGRTKGTRQSPSYTLGLAKVSKLYKRKEFEYALVEINNMLSFYPSSPKLHKMKGTVLVKMRNLPMAERSWIRALELSPRDKILRKAISKLQRKIKNQFVQNRQASTPDNILDIPQTVSPQIQAKNLLEGEIQIPKTRSRQEALTH